jgi:valyl-tRNA synthetase
MSKSLGTGIDPLDLVEQYGADALRFGLITSGSTHQQEIRFSSDRVEQARNFANKVWNVARAVLTNQGPEPGELRFTLADRWILSRMNQTVADVTADLERFEFSGAGGKIFDFIWSELADWYLEIAKLRLYDEQDPNGRYTARAVSWAVLSTSLRVLHPYMPFLTEEIWAHLRDSGSIDARALSHLNLELPESIMTSPWPVPDALEGPAVSQMDQVMEIIRSVRAARSEYRVAASKYISAVIVAPGDSRYLREEEAVISRLARLEPLQILSAAEAQSEQQLTLLIGEVTVYLPLDEMSDVEAEHARLSKDLEDAGRALSAVKQKLANADFTTRAPAQVVERQRGRESELEAQVARLKDRLNRLRST